MKPGIRFLYFLIDTIVPMDKVYLACTLYGTKIYLNMKKIILRVPLYPLKPKKGVLGNIVVCIIAPSCSDQTTAPILVKFAQNVYF